MISIVIKNTQLTTLKDMTRILFSSLLISYLTTIFASSLADVTSCNNQTIILIILKIFLQLKHQKIYYSASR